MASASKKKRFSFQNYVRHREIGDRKPIGFDDAFAKQIYNTISPHASWDNKDGNVHGGVFNLEFSPDGSILVAACEKRSILLFDSLNMKQMGSIENAHQDCVNCVRFLDNRTFATCSDDNTVALWDARNMRTRTRTLSGHSNWVKNIEYVAKDGLLVTSGFDGSIYTWDLNSNTEHCTYNRVFRTNGLMRTRLTTDASKMIISTSDGYLLIIHDLDLNALERDLAGFKPNLYRLMQISDTMIPMAAVYTPLFSRGRKKNRLEFIVDFPEEDDAEVVSSLQVHPQGWCVVSRNISHDENTEWTCVHELLTDNKSEEDEGEPHIVESANQAKVAAVALRSQLPNDLSVALARGYRSLARMPPSELPPPPEQVAAASSSSVLNTRTYAPVIHRGQDGSAGNGLDEIDVEIREIPRRPRISGNTLILPYVPEELFLTQYPSRRDLLADAYLYPYGLVSRYLQAHEEHLCIPIPTTHKIHANKNRLTHYTQEPNMGKGFIKELCFSADGRVICSPYGYGVRLLSFNSDCSELPNCMPTELTQLNVLLTKSCHRDFVVSSKFSPTHYTVITGCLSGKIIWYQPYL